MTNPTLFLALVAFIGMCIQTYRFGKVKKQIYYIYRYINVISMVMTADKLIEEIDKKYRESLKQGDQR